MINKIYHLSDLHFKTYTGHKSSQAVINKFLSDIDEGEPDRIVITGDIVHQYNYLTPELVGLVNWFLNECQRRAKTIIIPGNHDFLETNKDRLDSITPIVESINSENLVYYKETGIYSDDNVNWVVYSLMDNNKRPDDLATQHNSNQTYIGLYHGIIEGGQTDLGIEFNRGVPADHFEGCDVVLAGDIHKRQIFKYNGGFVIMVGSTIQQNYGEALNGHGYCILEIPSLNYNFVDIPSPVQFYKIQVENYEDIFNDNEKVVNG